MHLSMSILSGSHGSGGAAPSYAEALHACRHELFFLGASVMPLLKEV